MIFATRQGRPSWEPGRRVTAVHQVSVLANRMLYSGLVAGWQSARHQAAAVLETDLLPSRYQLQYQMQIRATRQQDQLRRMRYLAQDLLEELLEFRPLLIGSVLQGNVWAGSDIDIQVFSDSHEAFLEAIHQRGWSASTRTVTARTGRVYRHIDMIRHGYEVEFGLYPEHEYWVRSDPNHPETSNSSASLVDLWALQLPKANYTAAQVWDLLLDFGLPLTCFKALEQAQGMVESDFQATRVWSRLLDRELLNATELYCAAALLQKPFRDCSEIAMALESIGVPSPPVGELLQCWREATESPTEHLPPARVAGWCWRLKHRTPQLALLLWPVREELAESLLGHYLDQGALCEATAPFPSSFLTKYLGIHDDTVRQDVYDWLTGLYINGRYESAWEGLRLAASALGLSTLHWDSEITRKLLVDFPLDKEEKIRFQSVPCGRADLIGGAAWWCSRARQ